MYYTTTSCPHCGYKIRNHESGVPKVALGVPIGFCLKCGRKIVDPILTEYEFMTDGERRTFTSNRVEGKGIIGGLIFVICGLMILVSGFMVDSIPVVVSVLFGGGGIAVGVWHFVSNYLAAKNRTAEMLVYLSLKRTENKKYVELVQAAYKRTGIHRQYRPYENKAAFFERYKEFEYRQEYMVRKLQFEKHLEDIDDGEFNDKADSTKTSFHVPR